MDRNQYRITIKVKAELVYYVKEYDIDNAIALAMDAPYKEWEVSYYDMPADSEMEAEVI
jgi:hypothetical protein